MVQVIQGTNPQGQLADKLGLSLGEGIGNGLNTFFANRSLQSVMSDKALKDAPASEKLQKMISAASPYGEVGQNLLKNYLESAKQEQTEKTRNKLSKAFGYLQKNENIPEEMLQDLPEDIQLKLGDFAKANRVANGLYETMVAAGVPEDIARNQANIIRASEKGTGQTYGIQGANDLINRFRNIPESEAFNQNVPTGRFSKVNPEFEFPQPEKVEGLTLKERASLKKDNSQQNLKDYNENRSRKRNLEEDKYSFKKLQELNSGIRTGLAKWNINPKTGEIIFPAAATAEERQFAKTIVRQLRNAKDTFGSRVTNFDAAKYLEGFPGLGDSPEAREAIIKDLQLVNELNLLHANAMEEVYRTYKPGEISPFQAEQIGDDIARSRMDEIWEKYAKGSNQGQANSNTRPSLDEIFR